MSRLADLLASGDPAIITGPMATLSHRAFRELLLDFGGWDYSVTEMTSAEALLNGAPFDWCYTDLAPRPDRLIVQLTAYDPESFAAAAQRFLPLEPAGLDMNMGCSAPKVRKRGGGAGWLSRPDEAASAASALFRARAEWEERSGRPGPALSAKLRLPRSGELPPLLRLIDSLAAAGVDWITLHGRRIGQPYGRPSSWETIARVASETPLPLCANGDIRSPRDASALLDLYPFSGIMPARAVAREPWLPLLISGDLAEGEAAGEASSGAAGTAESNSTVSRVVGRDIPATYLDTAERFHSYLEKYLPPEFWKTRGRRFHTYFAGNFAFGHQLSSRVQHMESYQELKAVALALISRWNAPLPVKLERVRQLEIVDPDPSNSAC